METAHVDPREIRPRLARPRYRPGPAWIKDFGPATDYAPNGRVVALSGHPAISLHENVASRQGPP
jgi:hypothetical protein